MRFFYPFLFIIAALFYGCKKSDDITPATVNPGLKASEYSMASSTALITNIVPSSNNSYLLSTLAVKAVYYTDRTYTITSMPSSLASASLIRTAMADKSVSNTSALSFTLTQAATVYVGYDPRATKLPAWLSGWQKLTDTIGVNDPGISKLILYSKVFSAGTVSLGGNIEPPAAGAKVQYIVIAKAPPIPFILGINGHSLGTLSYAALTPETQVSMLKKMGLTYYRQDIAFNTDGSIPNQALFTQLYAATTAAGVTMLPMVYTNINYNLTKAESYAAGKQLGVNVATKNARYFSYYELGNELDNDVILSGNGNRITDYDAAKFAILAAYLKGVDIGIKLVQPKAKTMINASWLHYAFLQMLISYGVNFDIVSYHWYSDMENLLNGGTFGFSDITVKLSGLFTKPIWFTEVGERYKDLYNINHLQTAFMAAFQAKCKSNTQVKALLYYELINEPEKNSLLESNYGVVKWVIPYTTWAYKLAGQSLFVE